MKYLRGGIEALQDRATVVYHTTCISRVSVVRTAQAQLR